MFSSDFRPVILIRSPYSHSNSISLSRKDDLHIKEALFEFIASVNRRI